MILKGKVTAIRTSWHFMPPMQPSFIWAGGLTLAGDGGPLRLLWGLFSADYRQLAPGRPERRLSRPQRRLPFLPNDFKGGYSQPYSQPEGQIQSRDSPPFQWSERLYRSCTACMLRLTYLMVTSSRRLLRPPRHHLATPRDRSVPTESGHF